MDKTTKMCGTVLSEIRSFEFYNPLNIQEFVIVRDDEGKAKAVQAIVFATSEVKE